MSDTVKGTRTPDPLTTTGNGGLTERLAEVLRGHVHEHDQDDPSSWSMYCSCGECVHTCHPDKQWLYHAHLAAVLAPVVAELVAEAKVEALREAADVFAPGQLTGMFGGSDGYTKAWLRSRADQIEDAAGIARDGGGEG